LVVRVDPGPYGSVRIVLAERWQNREAPSRAPVCGVDGPRTTILRMAVVQYDSKENAGHRFWTARYGRYAVRIDANRPGIYRWIVTLEGRTVRNGVAPDRDEAAAAVSGALDELPH
jgi:hypothetical protein